MIRSVPVTGRYRITGRAHRPVGYLTANRTIYQWSVTPSDKGGPITRSTAWTNTVGNRFRQKSGEIEAFRTLEIGSVKWCKEHIPHKDNDLTDEGLLLLDDIELWWEKQNLLWACHNSRKKDRMNEDGTFLTQKGAISATFTSDWCLRKGECRDKLGKWLKNTTVRSQDQRRMLQAITHSFPSNYWRNKITKAKESDKCDLCRALQTAEPGTVYHRRQYPSSNPRTHTTRM